MNAEPDHRPCRLVAIIAMIVCHLAGCSRLIDPNVPEPLILRKGPQTGRTYLLYRPSRYDPAFNWPLIVVLHGGFPDSANQRIREWTTLAETHGFLVAAPTLVSTRRTFTRDVEKKLTRLRGDDQRILSVIAHIRAGQNVSRDRIFLHGYKKGAQAALYTGLRHPDLFRAISVTQSILDETCLSATADLIDHQQPILVHYEIADTLFGNKARKCADWLRAHGAAVEEDTTSRDLTPNAARSVLFFQDLLRKPGWFLIRALPAGPGQPLGMRFKLRTDDTPSNYRWQFGDGTTSTQPEPVHTYDAPGTYRVVLTITGRDRQPHRRAITLRVPEGTISNTNLDDEESEKRRSPPDNP